MYNQYEKEPTHIRKGIVGVAYWTSSRKYGGITIEIVEITEEPYDPDVCCTIKFKIPYARPTKGYNRSDAIDYLIIGGLEDGLVLNSHIPFRDINSSTIYQGKGRRNTSGNFIIITKERKCQKCGKDISETPSYYYLCFDCWQNGNKGQY